MSSWDAQVWREYIEWILVWERGHGYAKYPNAFVANQRLRSVPNCEFTAETLNHVINFGNEASRNYVGDLVWLSYNPKPHRPRRGQPGHGALMIGITKEGARKLYNHLIYEKPRDIDLAIRDFCIDETEREAEDYSYDGLHCCYLSPGFGGHYSHISHCQEGPDQFLRQFPWKDNPNSDGVAASGIYELRHFIRSGEPQMISQIDVKKEARQWTTSKDSYSIIVSAEDDWTMPTKSKRNSRKSRGVYRCDARRVLPLTADCFPYAADRRECG